MNPPPTFSSKAAARAWGREFRSWLHAEEHRLITRRITERLVQAPFFTEARTLLTYVGSKPGELDTLPIIEHALALGISVGVPRSHPEGVLEWVRLEDISDLAVSSWGILEPVARVQARIACHDGLCLVPGICFRRDGHRIGYGRGYFDRFLSGFAGMTVALSPAALFGVNFPVEPHDRPVDVVVTERSIYETRALTSG